MRRLLACLALTLCSMTRAQISTSGMECLKNELSEKCKCVKDVSLSVECAATNASQLYLDFGKINFSGDQVKELQIHDSDISDWDGPPEDVALTIEILRLSSVAYDRTKLNNVLTKAENLKRFVLDNADIANLGRIELDLRGGLRSLRLLNDHIKEIDENYFLHLKTIEDLELSDNRLTSVPRAVFQLENLNLLDLNGNAIKDVRDEEAAALKDLVHLVDLKMDNINCSCEASKGKFYSFVKERRLNSVLCRTPAKFDTQPLADKTVKHLCGGGATSVISSSLLVALVLFWVKKWIT